MVGALVSVVQFIGPPSHSEMKKLRIEGDALINKIEEYKMKNNVYPVSLEKIGIKNTTTSFGGWKYKLENTGGSFFLSIGEYEKHLFILYWSSGSGQWHADR